MDFVTYDDQLTPFTLFYTLLNLFSLGINYRVSIVEGVKTFSIRLKFPYFNRYQ